MKSKIQLITVVILSFILTFGYTNAEEGMWTFDNPPLKQLKEKYGFVPTQEWLDHVRMSSLRINAGGSGSFVSPDGLVMTNHHVGVFTLQRMSTPENNLVENGFYAEDREDELKCTGLSVSVLMSFDNVTNRIKKAESDGKNADEVSEKRKDEIKKIEKEEDDKTGLNCSVIDLYHGGEYWVYRYKRFKDIRLVFAPEQSIAYFGGDDDNFTFPRYNLDVTFFRVYEDGKPYKPDHYFKWKTSGAENNELVFISGNPGRTDRLYTNAQLRMQRDFYYPMILNMMKSRKSVLEKYSSKSKENERRAKIELFGLNNGLKAYSGTLEGLQNKELLAKHLKEETLLREKVKADPELNKKYGSTWDNIEKLLNDYLPLSNQHFNRRFVSTSGLARTALTIVRYVTEKGKPEEDRLPGYSDSRLDRIKSRFSSKSHIYKDLEELKMASSLRGGYDALPKDDEFYKKLLEGKTPEEFAKKAINNTILDSVKYKEKLAEGSLDDLKKSKDPLVQAALRVDDILRKMDDEYNHNYKNMIDQESEKIAEARFAVFGKDIYPDANFTLRLSYGTVKNYQMNGTYAPYFTTLYGLYDRALSFKGNKEYVIPRRYWDNVDDLDLSTKVNFVSTNDIIGGNSGSPVINKNAEIVGLVFDGNIESLPGRFVYDIKANRAVSVHPEYIIETLNELYDADDLVDELKDN